WYSTMGPGDTTIVAFMSDTDLIREGGLHEPANWMVRLRASELTRERLRGAKPKSRQAVFAANSQRLSIVAGPGWVAAGDAASAFDPLSSEGILKAIRSGKLASFVAADYLGRGLDSHGRYVKICTAEYEAYEKTKHEYYAREQRWPDSVFWRRRHSASGG